MCKFEVLYMVLFGDWLLFISVMLVKIVFVFYDCYVIDVCLFCLFIFVLWVISNLIVLMFFFFL